MELKSAVDQGICWLVLAHAGDPTAHWVATALPALADLPVMYVTDIDLIEAVWSHHSYDDTIVSTLQLADGRKVDSGLVGATFNRLTHISPHLVEPLAEEDRLYGLQELSALMVSWLSSLGGVVINQPGTRGWSGAWRSSGEWALLAATVGLRPAPVLAGGVGFGPGSVEVGWHTTCPWDPIVEDVLIVGDSVFSDIELSQHEVRAFRRLAHAADSQVLGAMLAPDGSGSVVGVTPFPDLRVGGDAALRALAAGMRHEGRRT